MNGTSKRRLKCEQIWLLGQSGLIGEQIADYGVNLILFLVSDQFTAVLFDSSNDVSSLV